LLATNLALSFGLSGLGDVVQQRYEQASLTGQHAAKRGLGVEGEPHCHPSGSLSSSPNIVLQKSSSLDLKRAVHMAVGFGLTSGLLCHHWYNFLDKILPGKIVDLIINISLTLIT